MNARIRESLRLGRCGPISRTLARNAAALPVPGSDLVAFGLLGYPRHGPVEVDVERDGFRWSLDLRDNAHRLLYLGLYEPDLLNRAMALLPVGGSFVDVGSNVGFWTLPAARRAGPQGSVISLEPNPWALRKLRTNIERNADRQLAPIRVEEAAVGAAAGTVTLHSNDLEAGASQATLHPAGTELAGEQVEVRLTTLDEVTEQIDLLKIDVEGHELGVLAGAERLFSQAPPAHIVIEIQDEVLLRAGASAEALASRLEALGYIPVDGDGRLGKGTVARPLAPGFFETVIWRHAGR